MKQLILAAGCRSSGTTSDKMGTDLAATEMQDLDSVETKPTAQGKSATVQQAAARLQFARRCRQTAPCV